MLSGGVREKEATERNKQTLDRGEKTFREDTGGLSDNWDFNRSESTPRTITRTY